MPHIKPLELTATDAAQADIAWLASATGFTPNTMLTLSHRPETAKAALELIRAEVKTAAELGLPAPEDFDGWWPPEGYKPPLIT